MMMIKLLIYDEYCLQNSTCPTDGARLQQALCSNIYQGFVFAYESMVSSQVRIKSVSSIIMITIVMIMMKIMDNISLQLCIE